MSDEIRKPSPKKTTHLRTSSRRPGHKLTRVQTVEAQEKFLKAFASNGIVRAACMVASIDRSTVRKWEEHDTEFCVRYNNAKADVDDAIRAEIFRRGMFGDEEYVINNGRIAKDDNGKPLTKRVKSDLLLMFHAKSRMSEYRDKQQVEMSGTLDVTSAKETLLQKLHNMTPQEETHP